MGNRVVSTQVTLCGKIRTPKDQGAGRKMAVANLQKLSKLHHFLNRRQAFLSPALSSLFEQSLPAMLTKHHDLTLGLPTWLRTHEHMLLNCPPILLQVFRGAAHHRRGCSAILSLPIDRLFVAKRVAGPSPLPQKIRTSGDLRSAIANERKHHQEINQQGKNTRRH